jgi:hypothetical protein
MSLKYIHCSEFLQKYQNVRLIPINTSLGKEEGIIEVVFNIGNHNRIVTKMITVFEDILKTHYNIDLSESILVKAVNKKPNIPYVYPVDGFKIISCQNMNFNSMLLDILIEQPEYDYIDVYSRHIIPDGFEEVVYQFFMDNIKINCRKDLMNKRVLINTNKIVYESN